MYANTVTSARKITAYKTFFSLTVHGTCYALLAEICLLTWGRNLLLGTFPELVTQASR